MRVKLVKLGRVLVLALIAGAILVGSHSVGSDPALADSKCCCGPVGTKDCSGTNYKRQSDYYGQTPYVSPDQPVDALCDDRCLHSDGSAVSHGIVYDNTWICSSANVEGRSQGVWYQCEVTRANAHKVIHKYQCQQVSGGYKWVSVSP